MSTKTTDDRLVKMHHRIDALQKKAHAAGAEALKSITYGRRSPILPGSVARVKGAAEAVS